MFFSENRLTDDEIEILKKYRDKESNARLKLRFAVLIFIALKTDANLIHQNIPGRCRGDPKFPPATDINTEGKHLNIFGAYNHETHSFLHLTGEENCNADRSAEFLKIIAK